MCLLTAYMDFQKSELKKFKMLNVLPTKIYSTQKVKEIVFEGLLQNI